MFYWPSPEAAVRRVPSGALSISASSTVHSSGLAYSTADNGRCIWLICSPEPVAACRSWASCRNCAKRIQDPCLPGTPADGDAPDTDGRTAHLIWPEIASYVTSGAHDARLAAW